MRDEKGEGNMNVICLSGRAAKEIELRYTQSGKAISNGNIAVQRKFKNAQGEYDADFIDFCAWGKTGELMAEHIKKGEHFGLTGELQTRTWEKNDGTKVKVTEVNVTSFDFPIRPKATQQTQNTNTGQTKASDDPFEDGKPIDISDEDLPF